MRRILSILLLLSIIGFATWVSAQDELSQPMEKTQVETNSQATDVIPRAHSLDRYSYIWEKSPFTLSSAAEEPVANFSDNFALVGHGVIGGKSYARILDKTSQQRFTVAEGEPLNGIELLSVEFASDPLQSSARVRKGAETGIIRFDPAMLTAAAMPQGVPPPNPAHVQPSAAVPPGASPPAITTPNSHQPGQNIPAPRRRRIIIPSSR